MHLSAGLRPDPLGSSQRSSGPLVSLGEGKGRRKMARRKGEGRNEERRERKGRKGMKGKVGEYRREEGKEGR